jgi:hypothetical protein
MGGESIIDASIARAMDRVLESERAAQQAVSQCRTECEQALEQAREQRLEILERAQARVMRLREAVSKALQSPVTVASIPMDALAAAAKPALDIARHHAALERLAAQLSGAASEGRNDEL